LLHCYDEQGGLDWTKYREWQGVLEDCVEFWIQPDDSTKEDNDASNPPEKKTRKRSERKDPMLSTWYQMYIEKPSRSRRFLKIFRRRFRLPYEQFLQLAEEARESNWFPRWTRDGAADAAGVGSSPVELLLLGSLRYLGRGWTFDDLEETTSISPEVHRVFFHDFIKVGSTILFQRFVKAPLTPEEAALHMHEMKQAGVPGVGSTDATHICMEKCTYRLKNHHLSYKEHLTARTYNMTVNHRRRILSTTTGHPARWNDKTLIWFDQFVRAVYDGEILDDVEFELLERDAHGRVVTIKYKGA
jgi:hypothetical protein